MEKKWLKDGYFGTLADLSGLKLKENHKIQSYGNMLQLALKSGNLKIFEQIKLKSIEEKTASLSSLHGWKFILQSFMR